MDSTSLGTARCSDRGCGATGAAPCAYVDRRQRPCNTAWCAQHQVMVESLPYCRRHAGVVLAIGAEPDQLRSLPDLENRAPSLVNWMARDLDGDIRSLMARYSGPGVEVVDSAIMPIGPPANRSWSRHWKVHSHTGFALRISIAVAEREDTLVQVLVEGTLIASAEPPWISARKQNAVLSWDEDMAARVHFRAEFIRAMDQHLRIRYPAEPAPGA